MPAPEPVPVEFTERTKTEFTNKLKAALEPAIQVQEQRRKQLAELRRAYKAIPEHQRKTFPWDGASNMVVPHVGTAVDAIVARLMGAILQSKDFAEIKIINPQWEHLEDPIRRWVNTFINSSGAFDRIRSFLFDASLNGDAFVEPQWVEETRTYHHYSPTSGSIVQTEVPAYSGVKWNVTVADDVIAPQGYDDWDQLPWFATVLRYTWDELQSLAGAGVFQDVDRLKDHKKERDDPRYKVTQEAQGATGGVEETYECYQIHGRWPIPQPEPPDREEWNTDTKGQSAQAEPSDNEEYQEVILVYHMPTDTLLRAIYNPYFGFTRHFVRVPFLIQPHELYGMGVAEQVLPFQDEATALHNQVVDAGTAANAGMIVTSPDSNIARDQRVFPGRIIISDKPNDIKILRLSEPSNALSAMEQLSGRYQQVRSGVSDYNLGNESSVAPSRATATGTTALINQGNIRFNVSIEDVRKSIEELLYLTIQQEQQFRPEGTPIGDGEMIQWPDGDPRLAIGLKVTLTTASINRDAEIQSFQILFGILTQYYERFMQSTAMVMNPQFPPPLKIAAVQVMNATHNIITRLVERFDIENVDEVVPHIVASMQAMVGGLNGLGTPGQPPGGPLDQVPGAPGGGPPGPATQNGAGNEPPGIPPGAGNNQVPF
jgi:hypothetical protein